MSEMNDLREKISDLQVAVARLDEKSTYQGESIDAMRSELKPIVTLAAKWKSLVAAVAVVAGAIGSSAREIIEWLKGA